VGLFLVRTISPDDVGSLTRCASKSGDTSRRAHLGESFRLAIASRRADSCMCFGAFVTLREAARALLALSAP
jgi:hypothetical protein